MNKLIFNSDNKYGIKVFEPQFFTCGDLKLTEIAVKQLQLDIKAGVVDYKEVPALSDSFGNTFVIDVNGCLSSPVYGLQIAHNLTVALFLKLRE